MSEIISRIIKLAEYYGVTRPVDFAKRTGFSHQTATNYLKGNRQPNSDAIQIILRSFDNISPDWLITGKGPMLKNMIPRSLAEQVLPDDLLDEIKNSKHSEEFKASEIEMWKKLYELQAELMEEVKKDRDRLQKLLDEKQK